MAEDCLRNIAREHVGNIREDMQWETVARVKEGQGAVRDWAL